MIDILRFAKTMIRPSDESTGLIQEYFLSHLLRFQGEALLSNLRGVDCRVGFEIQRNHSVLRYVLVLADGAIESIKEGWKDQPEIVYRTNEETFFQVVGGWQRAESAFLRGRIKIRGNFLRGLKLAFLLQEFFDRFPYRPGDIQVMAIQERVYDQEEEVFPEDLIEERIQIQDDLQIKAVYREMGPPTMGVVLVPPHPYLGGTSENRLLLKFCSALASSGAFVVRFDYRQPLGDSNNTFLPFWEKSDSGHRFGVAELLAIHRWITGQPFLRDRPTAWVGYSYGAQVCLWTLEEKGPDRLTLISPVVSQIREERFNCREEALLICGTEDFATTPTEFQNFSESFRVTPKTRLICGADHFFTNKEDVLVEALCGYLDGFQMGRAVCEEGVWK